MTYFNDVWDVEERAFKQVPCSPEEIAEIEARKTALPTLEEYVKSVQAALDAKAMEKGYDNIISACSYAGAANPFQSEGVAFVTWRGLVWAKCYELMGEVQSGTRPQPTMAQLLAELPEYQP
jgi:hypothetical protein